MGREQQEMKICTRAMPGTGLATGWSRRFVALGLTLCLLWAAAARVSPAQNEEDSNGAAMFTTLINFDLTNGANPSGLVQGLDGNFYGTTSFGGTHNYGTVFKITPSGKLIWVDSFDSTNGANPFTGLVQGLDGNFYGTTTGGGTSDNGTVFKISPGGTLIWVYSFWCKALTATSTGQLTISGPTALARSSKSYPRAN